MFRQNKIWIHDFGQSKNIYVCYFEELIPVRVGQDYVTASSTSRTH